MTTVPKISQKQVLQDWTRVDDLPVSDSERRSYEYHVVQDVENDRVTLTIKCFNTEAQTVRLDPTDIPPGDDVSDYSELAARRVRHLFDTGKI